MEVGLLACSTLDSLPILQVQDSDIIVTRVLPYDKRCERTVAGQLPTFPPEAGSRNSHGSAFAEPPASDI